MSKVISPVTKRECSRSSIFSKNTRPIQKIIQKIHGIKVPLRKIVVSRNAAIYTSNYFKLANFDDHTYIAQLEADCITFYRTIYQHSNPSSIHTTVKNQSFDNHKEKIVKILSWFYNDVNIVCITSCTIQSNMNNPIYSVIAPNIFLLDHYIKIIANNPKHKNIKDLANFIKYQEIDFRTTCVLQQTDEKKFENFLNKVNSDFIPKYLDIKLDKDMSLEEFDNNLSVLEMYMI